MTVPLHPDHLADLRRSGLTDETIAALDIFSARPHDIPQLVGFNPPASVTSALVFKYPGLDFCRVKVFPPYRDKDGKLVKYLQRPGSGVPLYIPPRTVNVLKNPTIPLTWVEGEKKSSLLDQEGIPCIGIGGIWNWLHEKRPVPQLDDIAHADREENVCPDSDVWVRPDLLKPAYALGKELEGRGALVKIVQCLPGTDGQRQGPDDLVVADGQVLIQTFHALKRLPLRHKAFQLPHKWWKGWSQQANEAPPTDAIKLIEGMEQTRLLHPAQEFVEGVLTFGVPVGDEVVLITSGRKIVNARELPKGVGLDNRGFDLCRFSKEGILEWQSGATRHGPELVAALEGFFRRFVVHRDPRVPFLLTVWTMGTYLHGVFQIFPFLAMRSPMKRCAKSRVLRLLSLVAFNASPITVHPTDAVLFRGPAKNAGTLLLDEVDKLGEKDKETYQAVLQVLNSRVERGGAVPRLEKTNNGGYREVSFPTYAPLALAGIEKLADTLEDRAIFVFMTRKLRTERVERLIPRRLEGEAKHLRDDLYIWALAHATEVGNTYEAGAFPGLDELDDDRLIDLFEPLLSIATVVDAQAAERGEDVTLAKTLTDLAKDVSRVRDEADTTTVKLIEALTEIAVEGRIFTPTDLLTKLKARDGLEWISSTKALATLLNPIDLVAKESKIRGADGRRRSIRHYELDPGHLQDLRRRYGGSQEDEGDDFGVPPPN